MYEEIVPSKLLLILSWIAPLVVVKCSISFRASKLFSKSSFAHCTIAASAFPYPYIENRSITCWFSAEDIVTEQWFLYGRSRLKFSRCIASSSVKMTLFDDDFYSKSQAATSFMSRLASPSKLSAPTVFLKTHFPDSVSVSAQCSYPGVQFLCTDPGPTFRKKPFVFYNMHIRQPDLVPLLQIWCESASFVRRVMGA